MQMIFGLMRIVKGDTSVNNTGRFRRSIVWRVAESLFATVPYVVLFAALNAMFGGYFNMALLIKLMLILVASLLLQLVCSVASNVDGFIGGTGMMCDLRLQIAGHLRRLPLGFYARRQTGELTAVMTENLLHIEEAFTHLAGELCGRLAIAGLTGDCCSL
ncbi:hypothetical protein UNDKW_5893 (plasmid) [Undibacterium sp. KW1]|uniref:ABC transporter transmembrane domain-containing protein n=1 Tax=Undibacterium sp. KW1 TaxID=2058624 RepID=UPI001331CC85|nr:ABC transporter transmembrane domain-containing protein [Undibacterium sp. KW1]BBB64166.1 hypothetical protein UNDKW_5893 [Undibacterium sp. KW1]